jgi:hypothetical protein
MTPPSSSLPTLLLQAATLLGVGALCFLAVRNQDEVQALRGRWEAAEQQLQILAGEMTRYRLEQRAEGKGVDAVLEKLKAYAPQLTSASVPQPEYRAAKKEMDAVLRATESLGKSAFEPIRQRFLDLPVENFDERKWLLEAMVSADRERGIDFVQQVLQGNHKSVPVSARQRWYAADMLVREDKPRAALTLRTILLTESSRGINTDRAKAYNMEIPDANVASAGFENFIDRYLRSEDSECADTLLMMLGRSEHDRVTMQECVKALGQLQAKKAVPALEKLFASPPGISDNPLFMNHCLDALFDIEGAAARPFFEQALKNAGNELVANKLKHLLQQIDNPQPTPAPQPPPAAKK